MFLSHIPTEGSSNFETEIFENDAKLEESSLSNIHLEV